MRTGTQIKFLYYPLPVQKKLPGFFQKNLKTVYTLRVNIFTSCKFWEPLFNKYSLIISYMFFFYCCMPAKTRWTVASN